MALFGKLRNRKERKIRKAKEEIQADYETETNTGNKPTQRYTKKYTTKEWNRFSDSKKQILSNRYEIILTDHQTRNEKIKSAAKKINFKNFDKGMTKFDSAQKTFWSEFDKGFSEAGMTKKGTIFAPKSKQSVNISGGNPKKTDIIFGKKTKQNAKKVKVF